LGKTLIIAEKPSVGRDIAKVLKCKSKGDGYLYSDEYIISWAVGHLVALADPQDYDPSLKKWSLGSLPIIPSSFQLKPIQSSKKQLDVLKKLMASKEVDSLICATDSGREGELIFRYIYDYAKCRKPFRRLWISSMTDKAITEGFDKLKPGSEYDNLYRSAKCRSEADWLVGINASRAYTLRHNVLYSIGRVQTPTLAIIVARQKEIDAFVPKDYWEIFVDFNIYKAIWVDKDKKESKIFEKEKAQAIIDKIKGKNGRVDSIEKEDKKQLPWLLYDLTELQRDCNRKFGYTAKKTLSIAQDLYEKRKLITYPRTDSRYLTDDMKPKIRAVLQRLDFGEYKDYAQRLLDMEALPFSKRIFDNGKVSDHHAIIPTESKVNINALSQDELNVYGLIARRFISVFYPPYLYSVTRIITIIEEENFLTKGTTVNQLGFMELYKNDKDKEEGEEDAVLPELETGQEYPLSKSQLKQKKTQPPKTYTEATLLSAIENAGRFVEDETLKEQMKDSGLGTPATRAAIIERLLQVGYLERKGRTLIPTEKGIRLISIVPEQVKSPETTGKWEKGLSSIAKGKMDAGRFMGSIVRYVNFLVESSRASS